MNEKLAALEKLRAIVDVLRGPNGCPWDRAQTLADMSRYMMEEASEVADAIDDAGGHPSPAVCEELGDLLMNIFLAARIAEDEGAFSIAQVALEIGEKLVRRHPHVFGEAEVESVDEVLANWNAIKAAEKREKSNGRSPGAPLAEDRPASRLDGVPRSLPPLERAYEIGKKAAKAGFDWPDAGGALEKVEEELEEVRRLMPCDREAANGAARDALEEELGDLLFAVVNVCSKLTVRPDAALRRTLRKFHSRFQRIEARIPELEKATLDEMEAVWQETKDAASPEARECK